MSFEQFVFVVQTVGELSSTLKGWVVGGMAALLLSWLFSSIVKSFKTRSQKQIITGVAVANGLVLELGFSPMSRVASELVPLSPHLSAQFPSVVASLVAVGTLVDLLVGFGNLVEGCGWMGGVAFLVAFAGGSLLVYEGGARVFGLFLIMMASLTAEAAPTNTWMGRRR